MSKAQEFLNNKGNQAGMTVNYQPALNEYKQQSANIMGGYQNQMQGAYDKYSSSMNNNLAMMKQQTQNQINALNQQLANNKLKYENMGKQYSSQINSDYKKQQDAIDQQAFNQYKYSNQMGANRGVSSSAQQVAMDNHVGQTTASLFNQNMDTKNSRLSELQYQIMNGMIDLDNQYSKDLTGIQTNSLNNMMNFNTQMSGKELEFVTNMADKIVAQQMKDNELTFATKKEEDEYRAKVAQSLFQMNFSNLQAIDGRDFQASESQKDRDFQAQQNALQRAMQEKLASMSGSRGGSSGGSEEEDGMIDAMMQYYMDRGYNPLQAKDLAVQMVKRQQAGGGSNAKTPSITQMAGYSTADRSGATSYGSKSSSSSSSSSSSKRSEPTVVSGGGMNYGGTGYGQVSNAIYSSDYAKAYNSSGSGNDSPDWLKKIRENSKKSSIARKAGK